MAKRVARAKGIKCPAKPTQGPPPEVVVMPTPMQAEDAARMEVASKILLDGMRLAEAINSDAHVMLEQIARLRLRRVERQHALERYSAACEAAEQAKETLMATIDQSNIAQAAE